MPTLKPFRGLRPTNEMAQVVASKSTDFDTEEALKQELLENPRAFLHVTKLHMVKPGPWLHPQDFLPHAKAFLQGLLDDGVIVQDSQIGYYVYRQTIHGTSHTGVIGLCDMEDYANNHIKRHEFTRHEREEFISALIDKTSVIGEPLLISHHHKQSLEDLLRVVIHQAPDLEFEKGGRFHQIWHVTATDQVHHIEREMMDIQDFYIMDGHHRIASVNNLYQSRKSDNYRYALSFVLDAEQLSIAPFHRFITGIKLSHDKLVQQLSDEFEVLHVEDYILHPPQQRSFVMKLSTGTYLLQSKKSWGGLDVDLFEEKILKAIFNIQDTRSDGRLQFLAGDDPLQSALDQLDLDTNYLFLLHPCTFREVAMTSDAHKVLPPKSTYVEPKCRAGLFIQSYGDKPLIGIKN